MPDNIKDYHFQKRIENDRILVTRARKRVASDHRHDYIELSYVLDNEAEHNINGVPCPLRGGDFYLIDRGSSHGYESQSDIFPVINIILSPKFFDPALDADANLDELLQTADLRCGGTAADIADRVFHDRNGDIGTRFRHALGEFTSKPFGWQEMLRSDMIYIIVSMMRDRHPDRTAAPYRYFVKYMIDYVDRNYASPISLSQLCRQQNYSQPYASHAFREDTGKTFSDYLQSVRVAKSCGLLRETRMTIDQISAAVGYHNTTFYYRIFKKYTGVTPLEYRDGR